MRVPTRLRNLHLAKHLPVAAVLVVAIGVTAGWAQSQPLPSTTQFDTSKDIAQSRALGYDVPSPPDKVMVGAAVAVTLDRALPDGVRDYEKGQCTDFVAHYIYNKYGNLAFFYPGRKDPRNGNDARRHHLALGGKEGTEPVLDAVVQTTEGRYGHVAVVTALHVDGSFTVTEQNYEGRGVIGTRVLQRNDPSIVTFLYIDEVAPPSLPVETVAEDAPDVDEYTLPASAIAAIDAPKQDCVSPPGGTTRLCKVPPSLVPLFEKVAREKDLPVALLASIASWESGFNTRAHTITSAENSCSMYQFNNWKKGWGFATLDDCFDPEQGIRKVADAMLKFRALGGVIDSENYRWYACRHNAGSSAGLRCAASVGYGKAVEWGAKNIYSL